MGPGVSVAEFAKTKYKPKGKQKDVIKGRKGC